MDSTTRLKTKIGDHEIEIEGPPDYVREQFNAWQELVKLAITTSASTASAEARSEPARENEPTNNKPDESAVDRELSKIMRVDTRYVSLTARVASVHDAVLLLMYGQKMLRNNDLVTGAELLSGLSTTGGFAVGRLDRILDKLAIDGDVTSFGERRGKKYRLTNTGIGKARGIAADLIKSVA